MINRASGSWRFYSGFLIFLLSLLCYFQAPTRALWILAIPLTEMGFLLAPICWLFVFWGRPSSSRDGVGRLFFLLASFFLISPLPRAWRVASEVPGSLEKHFGKTSLDPTWRKAPLVFGDFLSGIHSSASRFETRSINFDGHASAMDVYRPESNVGERSPIVIVVHGGSWRSGDRTEIPELNRYLAARHYVVLAPDYRLAPEFPFPDAGEDIKSVIAYAKAHADELHADPSRITLLGRSAGGQIALWVAYTVHDPAIRGVIAFYSPTDMELAYALPSNPLILNSHDILKSYMGGPIDELYERYLAASPLNYVGEKSPPTFLIHGSRDELVWPIHDVRLMYRLNHYRRPAYFLALPWATHGGDYIFRGLTGQITTYAIERFLSSVNSARNSDVRKML